MNMLIKLWYVIQIVYLLLMVALVSAETPGQHSVASASAKASPYAYASNQVPLSADTILQKSPAPPTS